MVDGNGAGRFSPFDLNALDSESRDKFLQVRAFVVPRVWSFLNRELARVPRRRMDPAFGLLALADGLIECAQAALEARHALLTAEGDVDVAALLLGLERAKAPTPAASPRRRKGKRKEQTR